LRREISKILRGERGGENLSFLRNERKKALSLNSISSRKRSAGGEEKKEDPLPTSLQGDDKREGETLFKDTVQNVKGEGSS